MAWGEKRGDGVLGNDCLSVDHDVGCFAQSDAVVDHRLALEGFFRGEGDYVEVSAGALGSGGVAGRLFNKS